MNNQRGSMSVIFSIVFSLLFLMSAGFGLWAFSERQSYKNDVDAKIETAVAIAEQDAKTELEAKFAEDEKKPIKTFNGSQTYGSLQFDHPKTWSIYLVENSSGTVLDLYASPNYVPGVSAEKAYALRVQIEDTTYDETIEDVNNDIESGALSAQAFRAIKVANVLGMRVDGQLDDKKNGAAVYIPLRDKTIILSTEAEQFIKDFNEIVVPSISFIP